MNTFPIVFSLVLLLGSTAEAVESRPQVKPVYVDGFKVRPGRIALKKGERSFTIIKGPETHEYREAKFKGKLPAKWVTHKVRTWRYPRKHSSLLFEYNIAHKSVQIASVELKRETGRKDLQLTAQAFASPSVGHADLIKVNGKKGPEYFLRYGKGSAGKGTRVKDADFLFNRLNAALTDKRVKDLETIFGPSKGAVRDQAHKSAERVLGERLPRQSDILIEDVMVSPHKRVLEIRVEKFELSPSYKVSPMLKGKGTITKKDGQWTAPRFEWEK